MDKGYSNIKEMLYDVAAKYPDKTAFIDILENGQYFYKTYKEYTNKR